MPLLPVLSDQSLIRTISRACSKLLSSLNEKRREEKKKVFFFPRFLAGCTQEQGGGGHSNAYSVQQGGEGVGGGSKIGKNAYVINGRPPSLLLSFFGDDPLAA